jgi:predicted RNA-binding protein with PIN domain
LNYFVDGYNLLFKLSDSTWDLQSKRKAVIAFLEERISSLSLSLTVVFEGKHKRDEESGFHHFAYLKVLFTPQGESADAYFIDFLSHTFHPSHYTIVTSDKALSSQCRGLGAQTMGVQEFLQWIEKKGKKPVYKNPEMRDSDRQIARLIKIFEERLREGEKDEEF